MATNITIAKLNTLVTANAVQFTQEMGKAKGVAKETSISIKNALGSIGVGLSAAGVIAFGKSVIDFGSKITDLAQAAGMSADAFQTISAVAAESGVDMETVAKASEHLRSKLQEAANGSQPLRDDLAKLNLTFAGLQALAPEKQWEVIAGRILNAKDKQQALNIASDLYGEKIAPKLKEVMGLLATEGFDKLSESTAKLKLTDEQLKSLDDAGDKLTRIATQLKVIGAQSVLKLVDAKGSGGRGTFLDSIMTVLGMKVPGFNDGASLPMPKTGLGSIDDPLAFMHGGGGLQGPRVSDAQAQMNAGQAAFEKNNPFATIETQNAKDAEVKKMLDTFFQSLDETEKNIHASPIKVDFPQTAVDRLSRIGLLTGKTAQDQLTKQTSLLDQIKGLLRDINANTRVNQTAVFA